MSNTQYPLQLDSDTVRDLGTLALDRAVARVAGFETAPASRHDPEEQLARLRARLAEEPSEGPGDLGQLLDLFDQAADQGVDTAGPGYLAYIPAGGLAVSAIAEMLAQLTNRFTGVTDLAPALVAMEQGVLRWLCQQFGLPTGSGGLLTTGGSMATLSALVAARHQRLGEPFADGTLYVTGHTHHSVAKAARIAGLPARSVRVVPTDDRLAMDPAAARRMIAEDRARGLRPFLITGTAGTTNTGTVDPLSEIARLAAAEELWFHVDAAYGGGFVLTERGRTMLAGCAEADSIAFDPHKSLFLPYGTGALLVRDPAVLHAAHSGEASYLQDLADHHGLPDYGDLGPELTRDFRGLRVWLPLRLHGVRAFRRELDEKLDLARLVHRELSADPGLEVPWEPELSVVVFRLRDAGDTRNQRLLREINQGRKVFLSSTRIDGRFFLRLCVLSHRTHERHVRVALDEIRSAIARVGSDG